MIKKLAFSGLGILFLASTLVASPAMATTDPIAELRIRIAELQEQLARLISQSNTGSSSTSAGSSCLTLVSPLIIGSTDAGTNGEVSKLQRFLMSESGYTGPISGYYGQLTAQAVMRWQKAHGMDFVTLKSGVGPMTRAKIIESCHSGSTGNDTLDPVIYSVTPSSGPIGTKITIKGKNLSGFEGDLNARIATEFNPADYSSGVMYGERTSSNDTTIVTTIQSSFCRIDNSYSGLPCTSYFSVTPGVYEISVKPWSKESNTVSFTVTGSSQNGITVASPIPNEIVKLPITVKGFISGQGWASFEGEAGSVYVVDGNGKVISMTVPLTVTTDQYKFPTSFEATVGDRQQMSYLDTTNGFLVFKSAAAKDGQVVKEFRVPIKFK